MAWPPCVPGSQASRIAGTCSATQPIVERPAVHQHDDRGRAGRVDRLDQVELVPGQVERAARAGLAAHARRLPDGDDRHLRLAGQADGLGEAIGRASLDLAALGVGDLARPDGSTALALNAGQERHDIVGPAVAAPVAERGVAVVGQRAEDGDRSELGFQRQHVRPRS